MRHGESAGNVARDLAHGAGLHRIDIAARDVDVPLSQRGAEQAQALGQWFRLMPTSEQPQVILSSPYLRATSTADAVRSRIAAAACPLVLDERLREREFGILDRLTSSGIKALHPDQAELRRSIGKFYHRPPGGESWCDVILRLRSALDTISLHHAGRRVLIVGHQVVVLCFRYLLENLTEAEIMAIDAQGDIVNCGVTEYRLDRNAEGMTLHCFNFAVPLEEAGAPVTSAPDIPAGPK